MPKEKKLKKHTESLPIFNKYTALTTKEQKEFRDEFCAYFKCSDTTLYNRMSGKGIDHLTPAEADFMADWFGATPEALFPHLLKTA
jgi:hypothetical protein